MYCKKCGTKVSEGAAFCHICGTKIIHEEKELIQEAERDSYNDINDFKKFVDNCIQKNTEYQTAEELLKSRVSLRFVWICIAIPAILIHIVSLIKGSISIMTTVLLMVLVSLLFGYLAAYIMAFVKKIKLTSKYSAKFEGDIDTDDLITFLNKHLRYLYPYFHEWGHIKREALSVRGAVELTVEDSMRRYMEEINLCTEFGEKQRRLSIISIRPDAENRNSGKMEYYIDVENRIEGASFLSHDMGFAKYQCLSQVAPILQAAMEYYLKIYRMGKKQTPTISQNDVEKQVTEAKVSQPMMDKYIGSEDVIKSKVVKMSKARVGIIGVGVLLVLCIIGSLGNKDSVKEDEEVAIAEEIEVSDLKNVKQAEKVFETWLKEHPLDCKPEYELLDEYGTWGNGRESYVYALGIDGIEYRLYVDREDGSMFVEDEMEVMAIDYWYDAFYGDGVEEVYDTSLNIDYDLVGRWRNQDGGMLEFDEFGNIVNIDFECWSVFDNPNYITWEAADGRVTCYSAFCYDKSYEIATTGENGDQELKFDRNGDWYLRDEEVMGEGLIGRWINKGWKVLTCQFNADGSGWWNDKYPISWYVYEAENEGVITNRVEYTIYDSAYFDYHVAGDILTVYLSNGSRMYTKVSN